MLVSALHCRTFRVLQASPARQTPNQNDSPGSSIRAFPLPLCIPPRCLPYLTSTLFGSPVAGSPVAVHPRAGGPAGTAAAGAATIPSALKAPRGFFLHAVVPARSLQPAGSCLCPASGAVPGLRAAFRLCLPGTYRAGAVACDSEKNADRSNCKSSSNIKGLGSQKEIGCVTGNETNSGKMLLATKKHDGGWHSGGTGYVPLL